MNSEVEKLKDVLALFLVATDLDENQSGLILEARRRAVELLPEFDLTNEEHLVL